MSKPRLTALLCLLASALFVPAARAKDARFPAELVCQAVPAPGRVLCELEYDAERTLVWGDALVVTTPDFAKPLRARVTAPRAEGQRKVPLAFLASRPGRGQVMVLARVVLCTADGACTAESRRLGAELRVGEGL
jgi:hypothetical protein